MLHKVRCKNMYQAEYGLKRPLALPRGLGRQVPFTMIDWQFRPSRLSTVFKSICLIKSCKMSTPLIHKKKHLKYNTYQYYVSLISSQPHYKKESVYLFHFVHNYSQKLSCSKQGLKIHMLLGFIIALHVDFRANLQFISFVDEVQFWSGAGRKLQKLQDKFETDKWKL